MSESLSRRAWLARTALGALSGAVGGGALLAAAGRAAALVPPGPAITVWKDANCGCCQEWVAHMAAAGFRPSVQDVADLDAIKRRHGVPAALQSCHTALVGGYVVEGHVPAADVQRLLREKPKGKGLAVPGMPMGSPGMEGPRKDSYDVVLFQPSGATRRFASH